MGSAHFLAEPGCSCPPHVTPPGVLIDAALNAVDSRFTAYVSIREHTCANRCRVVHCTQL